MNARTICRFLPLIGLLLFGRDCSLEAAELQPAVYQKGVIIRFEGVILPQLERYLYRKLDRAHELGADLVVLEIDSPGGALEPTLNIAVRLRDLDWAHTVAYVPDEALSGAAIMSLGCDEIIMHPRARLGDAGPIFQGPDALFRHAPEKIRSDLARRVRDLAEAKGRPPALAEAMVDMDLEVYRVVNQKTDEISFMSEHELASLDDPGLWKKDKLVLESRKKSFLEVNGQRAVELKLASTTVNDREELRKRYRLPEPLIVLKTSVVDRAVDILNFPLVTGLLFVIGLIALYVEFSAPGIGVGGLIAGLCFALFFWSRFLGGTAGWLEVILVLGGLVFLAVELFIIPGFGVAGVTGILMMLAGIVMASQNHLIPQSPRALTHLGNSLIVLACSGVVVAIAAVALSRHFGSVPILNRLVLRTPAADTPATTDALGKPLPPAGRYQVQTGDWGVAESPLRPAGKAIFGEEYVDVVTDGSFVERGSQVRIIEISGNRVVVREVEPVVEEDHEA